MIVQTLISAVYRNFGIKFELCLNLLINLSKMKGRGEGGPECPWRKNIYPNNFTLTSELETISASFSIFRHGNIGYSEFFIIQCNHGSSRNSYSLSKSQ